MMYSLLYFRILLFSLFFVIFIFIADFLHIYFNLVTFSFFLVFFFFFFESYHVIGIEETRYFYCNAFDNISPI